MNTLATSPSVKNRILRICRIFGILWAALGLIYIFLLFVFLVAAPSFLRPAGPPDPKLLLLPFFAVYFVALVVPWTRIRSSGWQTVLSFVVVGGTALATVVMANKAGELYTHAEGLPSWIKLCVTFVSIPIWLGQVIALRMIGIGVWQRGRRWAATVVLGLVVLIGGIVIAGSIEVQLAFEWERLVVAKDGSLQGVICTIDDECSEFVEKLGRPDEIELVYDDSGYSSELYIYRRYGIVVTVYNREIVGRMEIDLQKSEVNEIVGLSDEIALEIPVTLEKIEEIFGTPEKTGSGENYDISKDVRDRSAVKIINGAEFILIYPVADVVLRFYGEGNIAKRLTIDSEETFIVSREFWDKKGSTGISVGKDQGLRDETVSPF